MEARDRDPFLLMNLWIYLFVVVGVIVIRQWLAEPEWFMLLMLSFLTLAGFGLRDRCRLIFLPLLVLTIMAEMCFIFAPAFPFCPSTTITLIPNETKINSTFVETLATQSIYDSLIETTNISLPAQLLPAEHARGWLLFQNETRSSITLTTTMRITSKSGIEVGFAAPVTISAVSPMYVPGYAIEKGPTGAIPRFAILTHILPGLFVENLPFQLNSQPPDTSVIERMVQKEVPQLLQSVQNYLSVSTSQADEAVMHQVCRTSFTRTTLVSVLVEQAMALCTDIVYDTNLARESAISTIQDQQAPMPGRILAKIAVHLLNATTVSEGVNVQVSTEQWWACHFDAKRLRQLTSLIVGKSEPVARALLLHQPGVSDVLFSSRANIPRDLRQIHIIAVIDHPS